VAATMWMVAPMRASVRVESIIDVSAGLCTWRLGRRGSSKLRWRTRPAFRFERKAQQSRESIGEVLCVKLILHLDCVVVSFHDEKDTDHEQEDA